jgi:hypothetical protein
MNKNFSNKYFVILNKNEIIFNCLNKENKISYTKKQILTNGPNNIITELENFFTDNLIEIERNLKDFIKKIYIIFDIDEILIVDLSIKYKLESGKIDQNKINDLLSYLKYQFTKYSNNQSVIHMTISKLLIDGEEKDISFVKETSNNLILQVKFECIKNKIVHIIKELCSNYQITVDKILLANHLRQSIENHTDDIISSASKFLNGENKNEVSWISKKTIKQGFFERFFKFFS